MMRVARSWALAVGLLTGACSAPGSRSEEAATSDPAGLAALERAARSLAKTEGCGSTDACRTAPVGWKACGGPRDYVVYCAATTDSAALYRKLDELKAAEMEYLRKTGAASDCMFRTPPNVAAQGGSCRQVP
jgi:hypothetical protein